MFFPSKSSLCKPACTSGQSLTTWQVPRGSTSTVFRRLGSEHQRKPKPAFLQGRGAHTGRRVDLHLAQRQIEVLPGWTGSPHTLPALGLELHYTVPKGPAPSLGLEHPLELPGK